MRPKENFICSATLLVLFIAIPLIELFLLLQMSHYTGWLFTLGLVILTGILGASLARSQGGGVLRRISAASSSGKMPTQELADGLMILVAGAVLLTPGVLTDLFGFSLLTPWCRVFYRKWLMKWFQSRFKVSMQMHHPSGRTPSPDYEGADDGDVIDSYVIDGDE